MNSMYNKLFTKILDSSIWLEDASTRLVWLTMIAAMDETGFCQFASPANLAHRARVPQEDVNRALACLEGTDENSSDPENEGRRIERVPGGWMVLNATKYRALVTKLVIQEQTAARVKRHRQMKRGCNAPVTHSNESETPSEAGAKAENNTGDIASPAVIDSQSPSAHDEADRIAAIEKGKAAKWWPEGFGTHEGFRAAWRRWEVHLGEADKRMTPSARRAVLNELAGIGPENAISCINRSISKNWKSIVLEMPPQSVSPGSHVEQPVFRDKPPANIRMV